MFSFGEAEQLGRRGRRSTSPWRRRSASPGPRARSRPSSPARRGRREPGGARRPRSARSCPTTSRSSPARRPPTRTPTRAGGPRVLPACSCVFGGIALLVGIFIIYNTFAILVAQRTRELALLRAVGASRRPGAGVGAARGASSSAWSPRVLGLLAGIGLAAAGHGRARGVRRRPARPRPRRAAGDGRRSPSSSVSVVTLLAAIVPAIRATRVPPLAALRDVAIDRSGASGRASALGILVLLLGALNLSRGLAGDGDTDALPTVGFGALLDHRRRDRHRPRPRRPQRHGARRPLPRSGHHRRAGDRERGPSPKRTSATASALIIGVALVGFITVFAASAKASVDGRGRPRLQRRPHRPDESAAFGGRRLPRRRRRGRRRVDGVDTVVTLGFAGASSPIPTARRRRSRSRRSTRPAHRGPRPPHGEGVDHRPHRRRHPRRPGRGRGQRPRRSATTSR